MAKPRTRAFADRLRLLAAATAASTLILIGAALWMLYDARRQARVQAEQVAANLVLSLERDVRRNIELYDFSVRSTARVSGLPGLETSSPEIRQAALFDSTTEASNFGAIIVLDADGNVLQESGFLEPRPNNFVERDWFTYLRDHPGPDLHISFIQRAKLSNRRGLVISHRIDRADGTFGGAAAGVILLDYFHDLFSGMKLGEDNVIALMTTSGQLLSREPINEESLGRIVANAEILEHVRDVPNGSFELNSTIDGVRRLYSYRQVGHLPLIVQVGLSMQTVYGDWARRAVIVSGLLLGFTVITGVLFVATHRGLTRRLRLETKLRESEASFRLLAENAIDMVSLVGPEGQLRYVSPAGERLFGVPVAELADGGVTSFIHPDDRPVVAENRRRLLEGNVDEGSLTIRILNPQRGELWAERVARPIVDPSTGSTDGYISVMRDITERKRNEAATAEANSWLTLSEQVANVGHWRYEPAIDRLYWSAQVYRIYGLEPHSLQPTRTRAIDACHPLDRRPLQDAISEAIGSGVGFDTHARLLLPNGDLRHVQLRAVVETGADKSVKALFGVVLDVTDQVQATAALQYHAERERSAIEASNAKLERLAGSLATARDEAERANRAKSRFLAGMSHELRTPLNGILGYAQLLALEGELTPTQSERVGFMLAAGQHLLDMVNQVLSLAEVEAGQTGLRLTDIDPAELARSCLELVRPAADAKGLPLRATCAADVPAKITSDATRFRQILLNILGNAVKFTEAGAVTMHVSVQDRMLRVEVVDTGPGIQPGKRHRLFQDFDRLDTEGGVEGAGLGLSLSSQLATAMGGRLGYGDNPAGGSRFHVELPVSAEAPGGFSTTVPEDGHVDPPPGLKLRILVVDDVLMNRDIAGSFLRAAGHEVVFAASGKEAITHAASTALDLALMDVRMPGMTGLEATRHIRALPGRHGQVPIVALTAQAFADQIDECGKAGMNGHLAKPFTPEALLEVIARTLAETKDNVAATAPPGAARMSSRAGLPGAGLDLPVLDPDVFERTASLLDPETLRVYIRSIAIHGRALSTALGTPGATDQDGETVATAAHALAGSAGMLGFERLAELCRRLERALQLRSTELDGIAGAVTAAIQVSIDQMAVLSQAEAPVFAEAD